MSDSVPADRGTIEFYCSPHTAADFDPEPALLALIDAATTSLIIGIYSLTLPAVAQAIVAKHDAGVTVRMVVDATEAQTATSQVPVLIAAGIDLRTWGSEYHLAHFKVTVADGEHCAWGSFNYSGEAESDDFEVMTTISDAKLGAFFTSLIQSAYDAGSVPA